MAKAGQARVFLSLGSNMGPRLENLRAAAAGLRGLEGVRVQALSSCYETAPVGKTDQPPFLNMAMEIETDEEPLEFLGSVKDLERRLGRKKAERWGPRCIDIDIVLWGAQRIASEELTVPHREFRGRAFVLVPLAEIAAEVVDPESGRTIAALAEAVGGKEGVRLHAALSL